MLFSESCLDKFHKYHFTITIHEVTNSSVEKWDSDTCFPSFGIHCSNKQLMLLQVVYICIYGPLTY